MRVPGRTPDSTPGQKSQPSAIQLGITNLGPDGIQPKHQIPLFTMQDMRFFQHFLQYSFPHHPLGNDAIWTHEVPCLSYNVRTPDPLVLSRRQQQEQQSPFRTREPRPPALTTLSMQYEFLMHSILGLAASELIASDASLAEAAMAHRLKSIQAIKRKLAESNQGITYAEGNALIATCFALTFQSVILEDGSKQLPQDTLRPRPVMYGAYQLFGARSHSGRSPLYLFPRPLTPTF